VGVVTWWWCPRRDCSVPAQTKLGSVGRRQSWHSHHRTCIAFHHAA
jgi:hypothetical protein